MATPILTTPIPIFFNQLLISINLYQHSRKRAFSSLYSAYIVNLKILQLAKTILAHLGKHIFSKHRISARIQQIIWTFFTNQIQKQLMTRFSNKSKPPLFLTHFPNFWDNFFRKIRFSCTTIHRPLTPCWVSEKTNQPIPRKLPNGRTEGQKDGQTPIHRTLPATARDPISDIPPFLKQPLTPFIKELTLPFFFFENFDYAVNTRTWRHNNTYLYSTEFMNWGFIIAYIFSLSIHKNRIFFLIRKKELPGFVLERENKTYGSSSGRMTL